MKTPGKPGVFCISGGYVVHFWCTFLEHRLWQWMLRHAQGTPGSAEISPDGSPISGTPMTAAGVTCPPSYGKL